MHVYRHWRYKLIDKWCNKINSIITTIVNYSYNCLPYFLGLQNLWWPKNRFAALYSWLFLPPTVVVSVLPLGRFLASTSYQSTQNHLIYWILHKVTSDRYIIEVLRIAYNQFANSLYIKKLWSDMKCNWFHWFSSQIGRPDWLYWSISPTSHFRVLVRVVCSAFMIGSTQLC